MRKIIVLILIINLILSSAIYSDGEDDYNFYEKFALTYFPAGYGDVLDYYKNIIDEKATIKKIGVFGKGYFVKLPEEKDIALKKIYDDLDKYNKAIGRIATVIDVGGKIYTEEYQEAAITASLQILTELAGTESGKAILAAIGISSATLNLAIVAFVIWRESEKAVEESQNATLLESIYFTIQFDTKLKNKNRRTGEGHPILINKDTVDYLFQKVLYDNSFRERFKVYVVDVLKKDWPEASLIDKWTLGYDKAEKEEIQKAEDDMKLYITTLLSEIDRKVLAEERRVIARQLLIDISNKFGRNNIGYYLRKYFEATQKIPGMIKFFEEVTEKIEDSIKNKSTYELNNILRLTEYYLEYVVYYIPETGRFKMEKEMYTEILKMIDEKARTTMKKISDDLIKEAKEKAKGVIIEEPRYYPFEEKFSSYENKIKEAYLKNDMNAREEIKKEITKKFSELQEKYENDLKIFLEKVKSYEKVMTEKEINKAIENYSLLKSAYQGKENIKFQRLISLVDEYWNSLNFEDKIKEDDVLSGNNEKIEYEKVSLDGINNIENQINNIFIYDDSNHMKKYGLTEDKFKIEKYIGLPDFKSIPKFEVNMDKIDLNKKSNIESYHNDISYYFGKIKSNVVVYNDIILFTDTGEVKVQKGEVIKMLQSSIENKKKFKEQSQNIIPIIEIELADATSILSEIRNSNKRDAILKKINDINSKILKIKNILKNIDKEILFYENSINLIEENFYNVNDDLNYLHKITFSFNKFFNFILDNINEKYALANDRYLIFEKEWNIKRIMDEDICESKKENIFINKKKRDDLLKEVKNLYESTIIKKFDEKYKMNINKIKESFEKYYSDAAVTDKYYFVKRTSDEKNKSLLTEDMAFSLINSIEKINAFDDAEQNHSFVSAMNGYLLSWGINLYKKDGVAYFSLPAFNCSIINSPWGSLIINKIKVKVDEYNRVNQDHIKNLEKRINDKYNEITAYFNQKQYESVIISESEVMNLEKAAIFRDIYESYKEKFNVMKKFIEDAKNLAKDKTENIRNFYKEFKNAYESKNSEKLLSLIESSWFAVDGTRYDDLRIYFKNIFKMFDKIEFLQTNLNIYKEDENTYTVSYDVLIRGRIFKNNLIHEEKSSVNERLKISIDGSVKIFSTIRGTYWAIK